MVDQLRASWNSLLFWLREVEDFGRYTSRWANSAVITPELGLPLFDEGVTALRESAGESNHE